MVVCPERPQKLLFPSFIPYPTQLTPVSSVIVFIKKMVCLPGACEMLQAINRRLLDLN